MTLAEREEQVAAQMRVGIRPYVLLSAQAYNLFIQWANAIAGKALSQPAVIMLTVSARVLADLRVCQWAAEHGYAIQASTMAATIHEIAYSAAYIGESEQRAAEWLVHENEKRQYPESGHAAVLQDVLKRLTLSSAHADQEYLIYRQLCLAKHGNPILQRAYGVSHGDEERLIEQLPYFSEDTLMIARFGLFQAVRAVSALLTTLLQTHFLELLNAELVAEFKQFLGETQRLGVRDEFYESGPDGMPMPLPS